MDGQSGIKVLYSNVQSVVRKMDELRAVLALEKPDVIALTETWTNESIDDSYLWIEGYNLVERKDRKDTEGGRGGGILVYAREVIAWKEEEVVDFNQCATICVKRKNGVLKIRVIYRSPNSSNRNDDNLCEWIKQIRDKTLIVGDLNFPGIDWVNGSSTAKGRAFYEACEDAFLQQHVEVPTHKDGNILDLVLSNELGMVKDVNLLGRIGASDHECIMISIDTDIVWETKGEKRRAFEKADWDAMRKEMNRDWSALFMDKRAGEMWTVFREAVHEAIGKHVPLVKKRNGGEPAWLNWEIRKSIKEKKKAWDRWKRTKKEEDKERYKMAERKVKGEIRRRKNGLERKIARESKTNPKAFFSYVNRAKKTRGKIGPLKDEHGSIIIDPTAQAEFMNQYYATVFTRNDDELPEKEDVTEERLEEIEISEEKVEAVIDSLRICSATGPDGIGNRTIKELKKHIVTPLTMIFRKSLDDGEVPDDWKVSNIAPIFKKGSRTEPKNYRPVNLTSNVCKVMEKLVKMDLERHLERNVLKNSQHGFRRGRSPTTNMVEFLEVTTKWLDEGRAFDVVFFDFSKAFDKVCHRRLPVKLHAAGVRGKAKIWICEWLNGRRQRVVVDGNESEWVDVDSSVPQGTVLGGTLFNLYVDDIDDPINIIEALLRKFADDTKMARIVEEEEEAKRLQNEIDGLVEWAREWAMAFNVEKCKVMHIGRKNKRFEYTMDGVRLGVVEEEKDLGVWMESTMKPTRQCEAAAKQANAVLGLIAKSFHYRSAKTLVPLYKTFVRPKLEYAAAVWSPWLEKDVEMLERVQKRLIRMISDASGETYEDKLKSIGLTTLKERRTRGDAIETFKTLRGFNRVQRETWFSIQRGDERATRANTEVQEDGEKRRRDVLVKQRANLEIRKNFFTLRAERTWNALPGWVQEQQTVNGFKSAYDNWCLGKRPKGVTEENTQTTTQRPEGDETRTDGENR